MKHSQKRSIGILFAGMLLFGGFVLHVSAAPAPELVKDINTNGKDSDFFDDSSSLMTQVGSLTFYTNDIAIYGEELWVTDGTAEGTRMVKDIDDELDYDSTPDDLVAFDGKLFFTAETEDTGRELWTSDGTEVGTNLFYEFAEGESDTDLGDFVVLGDSLYFISENMDGNDTLWVTDGTVEGTQMVVDLETVLGSTDYYAEILDSTDSAIYGYIYDYDNSIEYALFRYDGTTFEYVEDEAENPVSDVYSDSVASTPGALFFRYCGTDGCELWKYDETDGFASMVKDITPGSGSTSFDEIIQISDTKVFFEACPDDNDCEPWVSDGTEEGTFILNDISAGSGSSQIRILAGSKNDGILFFEAYDSGSQLWVTDGTVEGTQLVYTLDEYENDDGIDDSEDENLVYQGNLYFKLCREAVGCEFFKTLDTLDGVELVKDVRQGTFGSSIDYFGLVGDVFVFQAEDGIHGEELWVSDGTEEGTQFLIDSQLGTDGSMQTGRLTVFGDKAVFNAYTSSTGYEAWVSDGTESGTFVLTEGKEGNDGNNSADPNLFTVVGDRVVFGGYSSAYGYELWSTDGTAEGTELLMDIRPGSEGSFPDYFTIMDGRAYFRAFQDVGGELWVTDGTAEGTGRVAVLSEEEYSGIEEMEAIGNTLYFRGYTDTYGQELWKSDGTAEGTVLVKDIVSGGNSGYPNNLTVYNGELYFAASTPDHGQELWKSDGTAEGTVLVKDIRAGSSASSPVYFKVVGDTLYFAAYTDETGSELWKSDGTAEGTVLVKDINPEGDSYPEDMEALGDILLFNAYTTSYDRELWKSDGTAEGTVLVKDINPEGYSDSSQPVVVGDKGYFSAYSEESGYELWVTDGTTDGTEMVVDLYPGQAGSFPTDIGLVGGKLFFAAEDSFYDREPFTINIGYVEPEPEPEPVRRRSRVVGGSAGAVLVQNAVQETLTTDTCPADQTLTQNLRSGARDGRYHPYTKAIVTEAKILQAHLNRLGFNSGPVDGILGPISDGAIKRMQTFLGTIPDGFVGPITRGLLNKSCGTDGLKKS